MKYKFDFLLLEFKDIYYILNKIWKEEKFPTDNGSEGAKWNYINREVKDDMEEGRYKSS